MKTTVFAVLAVVALLAFGYTSSAHAAINLYGPHQVSQFIGKDVKGINGETLGTIRDFVTDSNGNLQYALLSTSREPGRLVAVPFSALNFGPNMQYFSLNMTPDQLANAPVFSLNDLSNPAWNQSVYRYYGVTPAYGPYEQQGRFAPGRSDSAYWYGSPDRMRLPDQDSVAEQTVPWQKYHNEALQYEGTSNPGPQGLWGSINEAPILPDSYRAGQPAPAADYTYPNQVQVYPGPNYTYPAPAPATTY